MPHLLKPIKLLIALLLWPLASAMTQTTRDMFHNMTPETVQAIPQELWWFSGGFFLWVALFMALPLPMRTYILAHELTHALWALCMGAKVSGLKVSKSGGQVSVSKTNIFISLAPYFFPFYSVLTLLVWGLCSLWWDPSTYHLFWIGLLGLTWSFHITFTLKTLGTQQPDVLQHGRIFSYTIIYLLNLATVALAAALISQTKLPSLGANFIAKTQTTYLTLSTLIQTSLATLQ